MESSYKVVMDALIESNNEFEMYDRRVKELVGNLVKARNLQPVDDAILQDIDDAIDALVDYTGIVVLIPKET